MQDAGIAPNLVSYLCIMQTLSSQGKVEEVERLFAEVLRQRIRPDDRCVSAVILSYGNAQPRQPAKAVTAFTALVSRGMPVERFTVQALARTVGKKKTSQLCQELGLEHLESQNASNASSQQQKKFNGLSQK